jgi:lipopolysaccharide heptosyltransferase I
MRILIVKLGSIGDVVHTLPALAALRRAAPASHLAWVVERGGAASLLRDNPCLDELIEIETRTWREDLTSRETRAAIKAALMRLRSSRFEIALDFQGLLKSAAIAWLARVPRRVGFAPRLLREPASALLLTERVEADDQAHIIKKNLALVAHLGFSIEGDCEFPIYLSSEDEQFAEKQATRFEEEFAIINPGGGWPTKLWSVSGFAEIADRLWQHYGLRSAVTYGPGEKALAQAVVTRARSGAATMLGPTLKQFFALARRAKLFIGGDTGPLHLAAAARAPIVGLYGPSASRRNGPFACDDVVVERWDLECRVDCYRRSCGHTSCMQMPVEMVWQGVVKRLERRAGGGKTERRRESFLPPTLQFLE